jgi:hypothetical protein
MSGYHRSDMRRTLGVYATVLLILFEGTRLPRGYLAWGAPSPEATSTAPISSPSPTPQTTPSPRRRTFPQGAFPFDPPRKIPEKPTAPPKLGTTLKDPRYACKRQISVGGKLIPCDSYTQRDGERLRPYFLEVPDAMEHLELYQSNRRSVEWLPYLGTAGLLIAGLGFLTERIGTITNGTELNAEGNSVPKPLIPPDQGRVIRNISVGIGAIVLVTTFTYGFITLSLNERNFDNAVRKYNQARPEAPIEIKVEGTLFFDVR